MDVTATRFTFCSLALALNFVSVFGLEDDKDKKTLESKISRTKPKEMRGCGLGSALVIALKIFSKERQTGGAKHGGTRHILCFQWSFGVTLWELITLGHQPYADIDPFEMSAYLREGYRISQPLNCPDEL